MPPRPTQQKPTPSVSSGESDVLSRIVTVRKTERPIKMALYGLGKTGKTRFAATFPKPILMIHHNEGTASIEGVQDIDRVQMRSSADVDAVTLAVATGTIRSRGSNKPYRTVVLDTAGELQDILLKEYLHLADVPLQRTWGMMPSKDSRQDWGVVGLQTRERLWRLLNLTEQGIHVVVIAHERSFGEGPSDIRSPKVGPALTPGTAEWFEKEVDHVVQCFVREEVVTTTEEGSIPMSRGTGKPEFCIRLEAHPIYRAGLRLPPGIKAPAVIVDGNYEKFCKVLRGEQV